MQLSKKQRLFLLSYIDNSNRVLKLSFKILLGERILNRNVDINPIHICLIITYILLIVNYTRGAKPRKYWLCYIFLNINKVPKMCQLRRFLSKSQDSLASLARRIRVCFSRQFPVRIRAHPRGAFNSVGACTPTELKFVTNNSIQKINSIKRK